MGSPGEEDERVVDGVGFLRRVNVAERPEMPETVVVVGGGDVAMDACRVAKRPPGGKHVKVIYRRGPGEIPARKIELHHAIKEDVEFLYHTQQVAGIPRGNQLALKCVKTALGEPDDDGRRRPVAIEGSEHEILCGSVIAAVGQRGICEELHRADMMAPDRVRTEWDSMRTSDPVVFAAGDGAFGGSTIVMAMQHGQRTAYYLRHFLEGNRDPLPYRTPYRTRRVPVAQDLMWEKFPIQDPEGADRPWGRCRGSRLPGGDPPGSERPMVATLRAGTRRPESRRGRGGVPGRRALAPDADRPRACRATPRPSPRLTP